MDVQTLIIIFAVGVLGLFWYSQSQLKNKIHCTFRRVNKTKVMKFVPQNAKYVFFDSGRYKINTRRITLLWFNKGIHQFFPQWVPSLDYSWSSENPHDPETFEATWDTPEAREASQQEDSWTAFARGILKEVGRKSRLSDLLIPMITIGVVVLVGYLVYQQGQHLSYLEQLIRQGMAPVP